MEKLFPLIWGGNHIPLPVLFFQEPTEKTNIEMFQEFKTLPPVCEILWGQ